ncbi:UbiA prenyltransferase family protein [Ekhidna sp.]
MFGRGYRFIQILSIDIVIGVVVLLRFFCAHFEIRVDWQVYALLACSVWLIYTADHIRDAEKAKMTNRSRYLFHHKFKRPLIASSIVVIILMLALIFYIPSIILISGIILAAFSFIYLLVQHQLSIWLCKEFYVAIVYSIGILMVPTLLSGKAEWSYLILLFLLTFTNLVIFSWYEKDQDERDGFMSLATRLSHDGIEKLMLILVSFGFGISILNFNEIHLFFLISFGLYAMMILKPQSLRKNQLYRTIGDGVFLLPIIWEWI